MVEAAGGGEVHPISFHGLRHSAASAMLLAGVLLLVVSP
jgi:integrase